MWTRVRAFVGATVVVTALWLITIVVVRVFASSSRAGGGSELNRAGKIVIRRNGRQHIVTLHHFVENDLGFAAWHKVAMVLILVALAALAVAGIEGVRRANRRRRRAETPVSGETGS
jgi:hypothetical protein